jgi:hypothetical protein
VKNKKAIANTQPSLNLQKQTRTLCAITAPILQRQDMAFSTSFPSQYDISIQSQARSIVLGNQT